MNKTPILWVLSVLAGVAVVAAIAMLLATDARARDVGQWENNDPRVKEWYQSLMRPDVPDSRCCGESDAYWADKVFTRDGKVVAVITDDRPDGPLGRPNIPVGTEFVIPPEKLKWDRGNPTGHNILFATPGGMIYCFVQGSGT